MIENKPTGFVLITHGVWNTPELPTRRLGVTRPDVELRRAAPATQKRQDRPAEARRAAFLDHVKAAEAQFELPSGLLDALVWTESRYNPMAVSPAGAVGLGQLMPATARQLGVADRMDPVTNLWGSARYLRQLLDRFSLVHLALAAYNAGPHAVDRVGGIPLNGETPSYVRKVLNFWGSK